MTLTELKGVCKKFPMGKGFFTALKDINLEVKKGEFCGFIGPSGSGKTTLLNIIGALDIPSEGTAVIMKKDISKLSEKSCAELRRVHMGFIFQTFNLFPVYTVYENVEFPLLLLKMTQEERKKRVLSAIEWVRLTDKINSRPAQLSGGESQRVAIARAVVKQPELILADEPTANLDADNSYNILDTMLNLNKELKTTFIFATHDEKVIKYLKRKIFLFDGKIIKDESNTE